MHYIPPLTASGACDLRVLSLIHQGYQTLCPLTQLHQRRHAAVTFAGFATCAAFQPEMLADSAAAQ